MPPTVSAIRTELAAISDPARAASAPRFFRTGKGEYGEGDVFVGATVPACRMIARRHRGVVLDDVAKLLADRVHEMRLIGLAVLADRYGRAKTAKEREEIFRFYLRHLDGVNNWDLVDMSAPQIAGRHIARWPAARRRAFLARFATSKNLWRRRVAMVATQALIREGMLDDAFRVADMLLADRHDLIHKAAGWMLREAGKKNRVALERFLDARAPRMPRTMLRYAIEKFDERTRKEYLRRR